MPARLGGTTTERHRGGPVPLLRSPSAPQKRPSRGRRSPVRTHTTPMLQVRNHCGPWCRRATGRTGPTCARRPGAVQRALLLGAQPDRRPVGEPVCVGCPFVNDDEPRADPGLPQQQDTGGHALRHRHPSADRPGPGRTRAASILPRMQASACGVPIAVHPHLVASRAKPLGPARPAAPRPEPANTPSVLGGAGMAHPPTHASNRRAASACSRRRAPAADHTSGLLAGLQRPHRLGGEQRDRTGRRLGQSRPPR